MKKILVISVLGFSFLFALNPQTASVEKLVSIKGVGEVKAKAIVTFRKTHKLKTKEDLVQVPGIGEAIADNILKDVLNGTKSSKKTTTKSSKAKKDDTDKVEKKSKKTIKDKNSKSKKDLKEKVEKKSKKVKKEKKAKDSLKKAS